MVLFCVCIYYRCVCDNYVFLYIEDFIIVYIINILENFFRIIIEFFFGNSCFCYCFKIYYLNFNINLMVEEKEEIKEMKKNFIVEKFIFLSIVCKFICVEDDCLFLQMIGVFGVCFLVVIFGLVIIVDFIRVINFLSCIRKQ